MSVTLAQFSHVHDIVNAPQLEKLSAGIHLHLAFVTKTLLPPAKLHLSRSAVTSATAGAIMAGRDRFGPDINDGEHAQLQPASMKVSVL
jgi:hypothetical protein